MTDVVEPAAFSLRGVASSLRSGAHLFVNGSTLMRAVSFAAITVLAASPLAGCGSQDASTPHARPAIASASSPTDETAGAVTAPPLKPRERAYVAAVRKRSDDVAKDSDSK